MVPDIKIDGKGVVVVSNIKTGRYISRGKPQEETNAIMVCVICV